MGFLSCIPRGRPQTRRTHDGMLPTFAIIGAMKSGTTSLHHYLDEHPEICMSRVKETDYFIAEKNHSRGLAWYKSLFRGVAKHYGETSPNYTKAESFGHVPQRMHAMLPHAKLIYVLRDPIERMISHYAHRYALGRETRPLVKALGSPNANSYLTASCYFAQLQRFLEYYPLQQFLVFSAEDLRFNRRTALRRVFEFLGVDAGFDCPAVAAEHYVTATRFHAGSSVKTMPPHNRCFQHLKNMWVSVGKRTAPDLQLDAATRGKLAEKLAPDVCSLRNLTGERFEQWHV